MADYALIGSFPNVPIADIQNLQSKVNINGDERKTYKAWGKRAGSEVLCEISAGVYAEVIAVNGKTSGNWARVDGGAVYAPVNLLDLLGGSGWTIGADSTYAAGLLTTDGGNDAAGRATQVVALKAGKYIQSAYVAGEGTTGSHKSPKITVTGATDGAVFTQTDTTNLHATAAEDAPVKKETQFTFTLTVDQNVTYRVEIVDQAAALAAGSSYVAFSLLEAVPV